MTSDAPPLDRVLFHAPSLIDATALRGMLNTPPAWSDPQILFDPSNLPPLLEIPDTKIASQAVRHKTVHRTESDSGSLLLRRYDWDLDSYEILEAVGDLYLGAAVGRVLRKRFPNLTASILYTLHEKLVRNDTISYLSLAYGLPSRLNSNCEVDLYERQGIAADLFEAHIGGLFEYEDQTGISTGVQEWLEKVFDESVWTTMKATGTELRAHKIELDEQRVEQQRLRKPGSHRERWTCNLCDLEIDSVLPKPKFVFDTEDPRKGWHARMYVDGQIVSCGRARGRKDAEMAAANNFVVGIRSQVSSNDDGVL